MKKLLFIILLLMPNLALAQSQRNPCYNTQTGTQFKNCEDVGLNHGLPVAGVYPGMVVGSTITRPNNTTTYTANTTWCSAASVTACVPGTISITNINGGRLLGNRVTLVEIWKYYN